VGSRIFAYYLIFVIAFLFFLYYYIVLAHYCTGINSTRRKREGKDIFYVLAIYFICAMHFLCWAVIQLFLLRSYSEHYVID